MAKCFWCCVWLSQKTKVRNGTQLCESFERGLSALSGRLSNSAQAPETILIVYIFIVHSHPIISLFVYILRDLIWSASLSRLSFERDYSALSGKESNSAQAPETSLNIYIFHSIKISCAITSLVIFNIRFLNKTWLIHKKVLLSIEVCL